MDMEGYSVLWLLMTAGGALVLGIAIAWGISKSRRRSRGEAAITEAGSRRIYDSENQRTHGR
ncbi:hypothetical protein [Chthonobacter rhizosphaerae]|uniref:hypothetical protein n=1 Tax=Chthonobacter rhizosphaerae TaxID=2735553 RepID=UPI0015EF23F7|nr:hypothetical protein [Chthonobacter rhizosphaerae]